MPLIIEEDESLPVRSIVGLYVGESGIGKTSMVQQVEDRPVILYDWDKAVGRSIKRKRSIQFSSWLDCKQWIEGGGLEPYRGGVAFVDTVKDMLDGYMTADIIKANPSDGKPSGGLSISGFGTLKDVFSWFYHQHVLRNIDIIFIAHEKEVKKGARDKTRFEPDITGGSLALIKGKADFIGYLESNGDKRMLDFNPTDMHIGKNPARIPAQLIPDGEDPDFINFNGRIIDLVKAKLSEQSEKQLQALRLIDETAAVFEAAENWGDLIFIAHSKEVDLQAEPEKTYMVAIRKHFLDRAAELLIEKLAEGYDAEILTGIVGIVKELGLPKTETEPLRRAINEAAKTGGFTWDIEQGLYLAPAAPEEPAAPQEQQAEETAAAPAETPQEQQQEQIADIAAQVNKVAAKAAPAAKADAAPVLPLHSGPPKTKFEQAVIGETKQGR